MIRVGWELKEKLGAWEPVFESDENEKRGAAALEAFAVAAGAPKDAAPNDEVGAAADPNDDAGTAVPNAGDAAVP